MFRSRILAFAVLVSLVGPQACFGWSEGGHNVIGFLAFQLLPPAKQERFLEIIKKHPRFDQDFRAPANVNAVEWYAGRASYWPDVARRTAYDRPTWHYQLGACLVMGDRSLLNVPEFPGTLPTDATLETQDLYIAQAVELSRQVMKSTQSDSDKALALCWLGHLVGDAHQPCHAGSLYCEAFPEGDRGANSIQTVQARNMHALWDQLLGPRFDYGDVKRRVIEITGDDELREKLSAAKTGTFLEPETWLTESRSLATKHVYTSDVLDWIEGDRSEPLELSDEYLKGAGRVARERAMLAAHRLAEVWGESL